MKTPCLRKLPQKLLASCPGIPDLQGSTRKLDENGVTPGGTWERNYLALDLSHGLLGILLAVKRHERKRLLGEHLDRIVPIDCIEKWLQVGVIQVVGKSPDAKRVALRVLSTRLHSVCLGFTGLRLLTALEFLATALACSTATTSETLLSGGCGSSCSVTS